MGGCRVFNLMLVGLGFARSLFGCQQTLVAAQVNTGQVDFVKDVAPILASRCLNCHADTAEGGFRLVDESAWQHGGDSGAVFLPGNPDASRVIQRITASKESGHRMPPEGTPLSETQIDILRSWITQGATWPTQVTLKSPKMAAADHWAFRVIQRPDVPELTSQAGYRVLNPIDAFVVDSLRRREIQQSPEADPLVLLRRVTLDLTGLPPSPDDVKDYLADVPEVRYEHVVDRLLASPHYGERWARPWLDLCHFADTDGYLTDQKRPVAWRYRDWLIHAFNHDMPFDQMTEFQLAGDLIDSPTEDSLLATGFLRNTLSNREGGADLEEYRVEQIVDRTQMVGTIWLGLTLGCARCHDHKYDPVSQKQFYELFAVLDQADEVNLPIPLSGEQSLFEQQYVEYRRKRDERIAPILDELKTLQARWEAKMLEAVANPGVSPIWDRQWEVLGLIWGGELGEGQLEGCVIVRTPVEQRTADEKDRLLDYFLARGSLIDEAAFSRLNLATLSSELETMKKSVTWPTRAPTMRQARQPRTVSIHTRGDFRVPGDLVRPGLLELNHSSPANGIDDAESQITRRNLSAWLMDKDNPLTARVAVNRAWQEFFGRGLVDPPDDFGLRGSAPDHPALLDWLAAEYRDNGWHTKSLHRLIVMSATYRQSSAFRADLHQIDPRNALLARQMPLRLNADQVRDTVLSASGLLCRTIGGPSVFPPQPEVVAKEGFSNVWKTSEGEDRYRRGLYTWIQRLSPFAQNVTFDAPPTNSICTRRDRSNSPLQALTLLNDPVFFEAAEAMARQVLREDHQSDRERISALVVRALARPATDDELDVLMNYLNDQKQLVNSSLPDQTETELSGTDRTVVDERELRVWAGVCSVILNLHELITRE
ncbi:MAG: PSD1 domain-containing protein [Planctomyces sp.]|nr:PSD1 domain-containing protein [Planctomyces sp.]